MAKTKPRYLLTRYGGKGDALFLTAVAHQLAKNYIVDIAINEPAVSLLENNPDIDTIYPTRRFGFPPMSKSTKNGHPMDMVYVDGAWICVESLYERYKSDSAFRPFNVTNYRFVIESNSLHPDIDRSQNSNYINTYDQHLGWAGIDPEKIPPIEKRPYYWTTDDERKWATDLYSNLPKPVVMIQAFASSPARTYFRLSELVEKLSAQVGTLIVWYADHWQIGRAGIALPDNIDPMRATAAMIEQADLLISADTCVSHLSEALNTQHVTYYSTVPAWCRSKYYTNEITVDAEVRYCNQVCKCSIIARDCPRRQKESFEALTKRERELLKWLKPEIKQGMELTWVPSPDPGKPGHERFGTSPQGFDTAVQAAATKYDSGRQKEAFCIESINLLPISLATIKVLEVDDV
jgi:ADP-heptose:LPS heptosyltransferase